MDDCDLIEPASASRYVSPHGKPHGLAERLASWAERMETERTWPWAGLGIIGDLKLAAQLLNLREFAEWVRANGQPEHRLWADDILRLDDTAEATQSALNKAGLVNYDPPAAVETLERERDEARNRLRSVRLVLETTGLVDDATPDADLPDLLRTLLA
jgi:hypothetical protein